MYREENDQVILTMSRNDYDRLLMRLGVAMGSGALRTSREEELRFIDSINEGNPSWRPYTKKSVS